MKIHTWPDTVLTKQADTVSVFDDVLSTEIATMFDLMRESNGIGLAANQVGLLKRVVVIDTRPVGGTLNRVFINPRIHMKLGKIKTNEGCLSFPGINRKIQRSRTITVSALDENGNEFKVKATDVDAVCLQHEIDHLNGVVFIKR